MSSKKKVQPAAEDQAEPSTEQQAPAPTVDAPAPAERPVAAVWRICSELYAANPATKRGEIIAACLAIGINRHTAATQIQRYRTAQKSKS